MMNWSRNDEILAMWVYTCFCENKSIWNDKRKYIEAAADICGLKPGSFRMKLSNIAFLEKGYYGRISGCFTSLPSASNLNKAVFREFFHNRAELCYKAGAIISAAPSDCFLQKNILKRLLTGRNTFRTGGGNIECCLVFLFLPRWLYALSFGAGRG